MIRETLKHVPGIRNLIFGLLLASLTLLVYSNSFQNSFQQDDIHVILRNPAIKNVSNILHFFWSPQMGSGVYLETSSYRPLLMITFSLNFLWGGVRVLGYHLVNWVIHIICALLVYALTLKVLQFSPGTNRESPNRQQWVAFLAALIFAVHPVQIESVTYITGRSSSLSSLFFLLSFWTYLMHRLSPQTWRLLLALLSFSCALMVKEAAITLPILLLLFDFLFPKRESRKERFLRLGPFLFLACAYLSLRLYFFRAVQYSTVQPIRPIYENFLTQIRAWVYYLGALIVPLNLNLDYDFPISHSFWEGGVIFSLCLLIGLALVIWKTSKAIPAVGFFALWIGINLLPTNSIMPLEDVISDRWLYLPSVGFAIISGVAIGWVFTRYFASRAPAGRGLFFLSIFIIIELYSFGTYMRNFTWATYRTLWTDVVAKSPGKARAHNGLGMALAFEGRLTEAAQELKRAIELEPLGGQAYLNLAYVLGQQGHVKEAIRIYEQAIPLNPKLLSEIHNNLGLAYLRLGKVEVGVAEFQKAIAIRPNNAAPYFNLGIHFEDKGDLNGAVVLLEKAVKLAPDHPFSYEALGRIYDRKGWKEKSHLAYQNFQKYTSR